MRLVINNLRSKGMWKARSWINDWPSHKNSPKLVAVHGVPKNTGNLPPFSTLPRSTLYRRISVGLALLTILSTLLYWKTRNDYYALWASVSNDWSQIEVIEGYRCSVFSQASIPVAANSLKYVVEFNLPDGYRPPTQTIRTYPPTIVVPTTDVRAAAFTRLRRVVDIERAAAVRDLIAYLRAKTGADLGDEPQRWIERYASATRSGLTNRLQRTPR